jgi:phosphoribosylaminoimidazole carboxylase PurE protein
MGHPVVLVVVGSRSDLETMAETRRTLDWFGVPAEVRVASAHREPEKVRTLAKKARERGFRVIIAAAGMSAHLAGAMASHSTLPVVGVPLASEPFGALDSLLSTVHMPSGVPVGVVSPGRAGAVNAALLAVEMLSLTDSSLVPKLEKFRKGLASLSRRDRSDV